MLRSRPCHAAAASRRSRSPAWWPRRSLKALKWSRSSSATLTGAPSRAARASSTASCSSQARRFGAPVSASVRATRASSVACSWTRRTRPAMRRTTRPNSAADVSGDEQRVAVAAGERLHGDRGGGEQRGGRQQPQAAAGLSCSRSRTGLAQRARSSGRAPRPRRAAYPASQPMSRKRCGDHRAAGEREGGVEDVGDEDGEQAEPEASCGPASGRRGRGTGGRAIASSSRSPDRVGDRHDALDGVQAGVADVRAR